MTKHLKYLVIHCTDTPVGRAVTRQDIEQWHLVENGWHQVGYSDLIHLDGTIENLVPYNSDNLVDPWEVTNGAKGYNGESRHVVYVGGGNNTDSRTMAQKNALANYVKETIKNHPNIKVIGHYQISSKTCPSFNVPSWLEVLPINDKNIGL